MAKGDVVAGISSVAASGVLDIKPGAGVEWAIHNIYYNGGEVEFYRTDGTNLLKFDTDGTFGARLGASFRVTNTQWVQMKNISTGAVLIGYDGVQTK